MIKKPVLAGLSLEGLAELLGSYPSFRSRQIYHWICRGASSFDEMSDLPMALRRDLAENYRVFSGTVVSEQRDRDKTIKLGISLDDSAVIEAVILRDGGNRKTACLSTQAGCPMGCVFCKTGMLGFRRNLLYHEIAEQFLRLRQIDTGISHLVIMGMGEPLLNLGELRKALDYFMDSRGLNISKRRLTLSTCGIEKGILDLAEQGPDIRLALSLTSARQALREKLMPAGRENTLPRLKDALLLYQKKADRRITLEIVLLGGINTGPDEAAAIAEFAQGLRTVVNLIPWNPVEKKEFEGQPLRPPTRNETAEFAAALEKHGLKVTLRTGKGMGISAACGQLGVVKKE